MRITEINPEVVYAVDEQRLMDKTWLREVADRALKNSSGKCRICLHRSPDEVLHEMLIAMRRDCVYPPHRFLKSEETHFVLQGLAVMRLYDEDGGLCKTIQMGPFDSGRTAYVRIPKSCYHDMVVESDLCVYLETKLGPFRSDDNQIAPFPGGGQ